MCGADAIDFVLCEPIADACVIGFGLPNEFVHFVWTAVAEEDFFAAPMQDYLFRQFAQPGFVCITGIFEGVIKTDLRELAVERIDVAAATIDFTVADGVVIVALHAVHVRVAHQRDGAIGVRTEAAHVAEAKSLRDVFRIDEKFFCRGKIIVWPAAERDLIAMIGEIYFMHYIFHSHICSFSSASFWAKRRICFSWSITEQQILRCAQNDKGFYSLFIDI